MKGLFVDELGMRLWPIPAGMLLALLLLLLWILSFDTIEWTTIDDRCVVRTAVDNRVPFRFEVDVDRAVYCERSA